MGISRCNSINGILCRNSILAFFDDPRYQRQSIYQHFFHRIFCRKGITSNLELSIISFMKMASKFKEFITQVFKLVHICIVLIWDQDQNSSIEGIHASFVEIKTNDLICDFIRIELAKSPILYTIKRNSIVGLGLINHNGLHYMNINPFYSKEKSQSHTKHKETGGISFNGLKYNIVTKQSIKVDLITPIRNSLGPLGTIVFKIVKFYSSCHLITYNQTLLKKEFNRGIYNLDPSSNIIFHPFDLNWCFFTIIVMRHPQLLALDLFFKKSGQVLIVHVDYLVIRSAKPYLATPGATVHGHYGEILHDGGTLVIFIYEKSRSGDITQGLPKVEQVLEVRSIDSISINLEKRVKAWNEPFFISIELTIAQGRISLVNKIQKVYRSLGVQIHNRHIEIIISDGMSNVFLPGELIGLLRVEQAVHALDKVIFLAKAALRGHIDCLKGLKENVVLEGLILVGPRFKKLVHHSRQHKNIQLEIKKKNLFKGKMRDILFHHREFLSSCIPNNFH
ncbi:unnamed protein product [Spirodela intermedia]|uniref:Uncharacterized protein n=1 Tax=Spirodela intermedia TaxID=51605 RepID=A0A7I8L1J7_SPIIN|nr:unnamed protein product [Spirodela intermedia]